MAHSAVNWRQFFSDEELRIIQFLYDNKDYQWRSDEIIFEKSNKEIALHARNLLNAWDKNEKYTATLAGILMFDSSLKIHNNEKLIGLCRMLIGSANSTAANAGIAAALIGVAELACYYSSRVDLTILLTDEAIIFSSSRGAMQKFNREAHFRCVLVRLVELFRLPVTTEYPKLIVHNKKITFLRLNSDGKEVAVGFVSSHQTAILEALEKGEKKIRLGLEGKPKEGTRETCMFLNVTDEEIQFYGYWSRDMYDSDEEQFWRFRWPLQYKEELIRGLKMVIEGKNTDGSKAE